MFCQIGAVTQHARHCIFAMFAFFIFGGKTSLFFFIFLPICQNAKLAFCQIGRRQNRYDHIDTHLFMICWETVSRPKWFRTSIYFWRGNFSFYFFNVFFVFGNFGGLHFEVWRLNIWFARWIVSLPNWRVPNNWSCGTIQDYPRVESHGEQAWYDSQSSGEDWVERGAHQVLGWWRPPLQQDRDLQHDAKHPGSQICGCIFCKTEQ